MGITHCIWSFVLMSFYEQTFEACAVLASESDVILSYRFAGRHCGYVR